MTKLARSMKDSLYSIPYSMPSCRSVILLVFIAKCILETCQNFCFLCFYSRWRFRFSRFVVLSWQRNHRKSFYCHRKYFVKENFRSPARTEEKFYCRNKTGNLGRAVSLHLGPSHSQWQHGIQLILCAHRTSHWNNNNNYNPSNIFVRARLV